MSLQKVGLFTIVCWILCHGFLDGFASTNAQDGTDFNAPADFFIPNCFPHFMACETSLEYAYNVVLKVPIGITEYCPEITSVNDSRLDGRRVSTYDGICRAKVQAIGGHIQNVTLCQYCIPYEDGLQREMMGKSTFNIPPVGNCTVDGFDCQRKTITNSHCKCYNHLNWIPWYSRFHYYSTGQHYAVGGVNFSHHWTDGTYIGM